jgi:Mg-chelatase subunit ChlD
MTEGGFKFTPKKTGIAALLEAEEAKKREAAALITTEKPKTKAELERIASGFVEPELAKERIAIIFDDSGSMSGQKIKDAHAGVTEFLKYCQRNSVAVAVHPMCREAIELDTNLPKIAALTQLIDANGGSTPMFKTWREAQAASNPAYTRMIIFSDGQPDAESENQEEKTIVKSIEMKVPVDTVYISDYDRENNILKEIAERTGGFYLKFDRNKVNFRDAFKYLSPGLRLQLADKSFRDKLQEGKI